MAFNYILLCALLETVFRFSVTQENFEIKSQEY